MPTIKQQKFIKNLSENIRNPQAKSAGEIIRESGYSHSVSLRPSQVLQSRGVQEMMRRMGLSEETILKEFKSAAMSEPRDKIKWRDKLFALKETSKIIGLYPKEEYQENQQYNILMGQFYSGETKRKQRKDNLKL